MNTLLALPYKKRPISSSSSFKTAWTEQKEYLRKVSGRGGLYQENKERRRSESFPWPESPTGVVTLPTSTPTPIQASNSVSLLPSTTQISNNNPNLSSSQSTLLEELRDKLKDANLRIAELSSQVDDLNLQRCDKDAHIRSLTRKNQDLQRRLSSYEGYIYNS